MEAPSSTNAQERLEGLLRPEGGRLWSLEEDGASCWEEQREHPVPAGKAGALPETVGPVFEGAVG